MTSTEHPEPAPEADSPGAERTWFVVPLFNEGEVIGDVIRAKNRAKSLDLIRGAMAEGGRDIPDFLSRGDDQIPEGVVGRLPAADDVSIPVQTQLIIELFSR